MKQQGIVLKNIDLTGISKDEQWEKMSEEESEFVEAFFCYENNRIEVDKFHLIEEFYDVMQAALGTLEKEGITAEEVMKEYPKHLEKIKHRPRQKSCDKCTNCTITTKQYVGQEKRSVYICTKMNEHMEKQDIKHYAEECRYYREDK